MIQEQEQYLRELQYWVNNLIQYEMISNNEERESEQNGTTRGQNNAQYLLQQIDRTLSEPVQRVETRDIENLYEQADRLYQERFGFMNEQVEESLSNYKQKEPKKKQDEAQKKGDIKKDKKDQQKEYSPPSKDQKDIPLNPVPIGEHQLPPLPYRYHALQPYIDEQTMRIHHQELHQNYVDGLNEAEKKMAEARRTGNFSLIRHWEREAAFNGAGHFLHTIFWYNMSPEGGGSPEGELAKQIKQDFGSFDRFKQHFSEAAKEIEGPGWAMLIWQPRSHRLEILQVEKHQLLSQQDIIPLMVLDVWEHAYFLKYEDRRGEYVQNWWNVVNWDNVAHRFREARKLRWQPF